MATLVKTPSDTWKAVIRKSDFPTTAKTSSGRSAPADLERDGKLIGVNDLHIAGHARNEGLVLVTNNLGEFERVKGLRPENWV